MSLKKIHFVGVGGVGTGSFAIALANAGYEVTGSDGVLYEPMKSELKKANIQLFEGYHKETLNKVSPECVVIGNVVRKENEEAQKWIQNKTPFISFPEAVRKFLIQDKHSVVVAGTHGKTTTTAWISFLLQKANLNPNYLIGGVPVNLSSGSYLGEGDFFVGEGDEYDSSFFDKGPKFLHYKPDFLVLNAIEFDHADIYSNLEDIKRAFRKLVSIVPGDGLCIARYEDRSVMEIVSDSISPVETFGMTEGAMWKIKSYQHQQDGIEFEVIYKNKSLGLFKTPLIGDFNLMNLLAGMACGVNLGISIEKIRTIAKEFLGACRRQQIIFQKPWVLIDDFAHHPTAVKATLKAVRERFPQAKKLFALFEPRSATSRRNVHENEYKEAFDLADVIVFKKDSKAADIDVSKRLAVENILEFYQKKGKTASLFEKVEELSQFVLKNVKDNDVVVVMSNGDFGGLLSILKHHQNEPK